ncbi:MAG: TolC family protein [Polyangia bacterium]
MSAAHDVARADSRPKELSLSEAYELALSTSQQVQVAVGNRDIADTTYTQQLTMVAPTITGVLTGRYQNNAKAQPVAGIAAGLGIQAPYQFSAIASIAQPVFRRAIFDARRQAALGIQGAEQLLLRAKQQLMFDVATVFIGVLQARTQVIIAQGAVQRGEQQVQSATDKQRAGAALVTAVLLAQIDLNRAQISVNSAEGALKIQASQFQRLIGVPPPGILTLPPTPSQAALTEAMERAPNNRADLRALHFATLQSRATVSQLESQILWPTLDITLQGGYVVTALSSSPTDFRFPTYGIFGTFTLPIFQAGTEWINVKLQKEHTYVAAYQESLQRRHVGDDVRQALALLQTANKAIEIATAQQAAAQKNYELVSLQYKLGKALPIDVLTAQVAVFEAETNKAQSQYQRELAAYQLLFAEGTIKL